MIEFIRQIPGPYFLLYFLCLSSICILIGWIWVNADGTRYYPMPKPGQFPDEVIRALRLGWQKGNPPFVIKNNLQELERERIIRNDRDRLRTRLAMIMTSLIIGGIGVTKLYLGIHYGKPVGFLVILLIISLIAVHGVINSNRHLTRLGRRYVSRIREKSYAKGTIFGDY